MGRGDISGCGWAAGKAGTCVWASHAGIGRPSAGSGSWGEGGAGAEAVMGGVDADCRPSSRIGFVSARGFGCRGVRHGAESVQ